MFQTYEDSANPALGIERAAKLRAELARRGLDGFLIPRSDEHQGEYVPAHAERLRWLTGFSGSAGMAIVMLDKAAIFVDGRYTLQVRGQVDLDTFEAKHLMDEPPSRWIEENLPKGAKLAYDPWLHTIDAVARFRKAAEKAGGTLVPVDTNPLDAVWDDQPEPPVAKIVPHPIEFAGEPAADKIRRLASDLMSGDADTAVLTMPDSIAWAFNIRGNDVPHTPLPLSFALLHEDGHAELFIDERQTRRPGARASRQHRDGAPARRPWRRAGRAGASEEDRAGRPGHLRLMDRGAAFGGGRGSEARHRPLRAAKGDQERGGSERHPRGASARRAGADEIPALDRNGSAERRGDGNRRRARYTQDHSGDRRTEGSGSSSTRASSADHPRLVLPYAVTTATNMPLKSGELFLVDSGAQYMDGTTDVTRTIAIGTPGAEERDRFTRVLKGHIGIATARFPEGTSGAQLDAFARMALWKSGLDYDHGTGHGVGPTFRCMKGRSASRRCGHQPLKAGMIVSNEPGYYKPGGYGIRIEILRRDAARRPSKAANA